MEREEDLIKIKYINDYKDMLELEPITIDSSLNQIKEYKNMVKLAKRINIKIESFNLNIYEKIVKLAKQHGTYDNKKTLAEQGYKQAFEDAERQEKQEEIEKEIKRRIREEEIIKNMEEREQHPERFKQKTIRNSKNIKSIADIDDKEAREKYGNRGKFRLKLKECIEMD
jgi:hypothetical protein